MDRIFDDRCLTPSSGQGGTVSHPIYIGDGIPPLTDGEYLASLRRSHEGVKGAIVTGQARIGVLQARLEDITRALFHENQSLRLNEAALMRIERDMKTAGIDPAGRRTDEHNSSD